MPKLLTCHDPQGGIASVFPSNMTVDVHRDWKGRAPQSPNEAAAYYHGEARASSMESGRGEDAAVSVVESG